MDIADLLTIYRDQVIKEWARRLNTEVSPSYNAEKMRTLLFTCSMAYDANSPAFAYGDFSEIDKLVEYIGNLRCRFPLSDVQKAFELYRVLLTPIVIAESDEQALVENLDALNRLLSYTIHKFSDYFQGLSEKQIRSYARTLEVKVRERTKELAESEDKYRTLVEEMRDGYCVNDGGKVIYANRSYCRMFGYKRAEVLGRPYTDFVAPESLEEVRKIYEKRLEGVDRREVYTCFRLHKDGRSLPTENRVNVVRYQGRVAALITCCDITERIQIEERIREAEQFARIGQLTTSLAHEIRNPLSAARLGIQMLLKNSVFAGIDRRRLEILDHEISRLDKIVTSMLDFARPMKLELKHRSMVDLAQSCLDSLDGRIREKGIVVRKRFPRGHPYVMMDYEKMEQVVINLLLNSVEAIKEKDGHIGVSVTRRKGKFIRVQISDNGEGIPKEIMPYVFDPFFSKKAQGTGLGLSNAKKIIEAHGGTIKAIPEVPRGVRISLTLPYGLETVRNSEEPEAQA